MVAPAWVVQHPHSAREPGATNRTHGISPRGLHRGHSPGHRSPQVLEAQGVVGRSRQVGPIRTAYDSSIRTTMRRTGAKQSASSRFCSHTVHAPAKPKPLRSHSIALYGASDVKRFRPRWLSACTLGGSQAALAARLTCWLGHADQTSQLLRAGRHRTLSGAWAQTSSSVKADLRRSEGSLPSGADHRATPLYSVSPQKA